MVVYDEKMNQPLLYRPDGLIFDMDGTLWDGVECYAQGFNDFFRAHGLNRTLRKQDITGLMGLEESKFLAETLAEWPVDDRAKIYAEVVEYQYRRIRQQGGILYEGVAECLRLLAHSYRLFIVSNSPALMIEHFMDWAGIRSLITGSIAHGVNHKPKFENIKTLIERHGLQNPVYIGDTDSDRKQSEQVPLPFLFVEYGFGHSEHFAHSFASFSALAQYLLEMARAKPE